MEDRKPRPVNYSGLNNSKRKKYYDILIENEEEDQLAETDDSFIASVKITNPQLSAITRVQKLKVAPKPDSQTPDKGRASQKSQRVTPFEYTDTGKRNGRDSLNESVSSVMRGSTDSRSKIIVSRLLENDRI
jgi:hypothetical protein